MEWLAGLATEVRDKITHFMYDDMCHLRVNFYIIALAFLWYLLLPRNMLASHQGLREVTWQCSLQVKRCVLTISTSSMNLTFTFTFDRLLFCKQQPVIGLWLRGLKKQDDYCQINANPHNFPELGPVNSVVCEQTFSYTNHYTNLKVMNGPRYNFFWLYILDLHNHYVEDHRVLKLNPLSSVRMDSILESLLSNSVKKMSI